ncbi:hypothetical protein SAMN05192545_3925 [Maribacter dokdonensis]|uniref:Uncharacterized protein n=1 Tax=Maribacter dokdonensis TaxID=320912 RepID=A0ABY0V0V3_9FLAO|nr:hypothetical protein [Maribacter dokdonensis]SDT47186.1 hypothetical protein SAMN05192545_3925 [Maribacter dokdonensis]
MYQVKEGVTIRPFGPTSKITGPISKAVYEWLIKEKGAKANQFETVKQETTKTEK